MLDVQGGPDVDAGGDQLLDILPALGMARARDIGVGAFVHQQQPRPAGQGGVDVELHQGAAAVGDGFSWQDLEALEQGRGLGPAVGLDQADRHVGPLGLPPRRLLQHLVGLAHARRHAEEHLEPAASGALLLFQQGVRVRATRLIQGHQGEPCACKALTSSAGGAAAELKPWISGRAPRRDSPPPVPSACSDPRGGLCRTPRTQLREPAALASWWGPATGRTSPGRTDRCRPG